MWTVPWSHSTLLLLQVLSFFEVTLEHGLSTDQVIKVRNRILCTASCHYMPCSHAASSCSIMQARELHGSNELPVDPGAPAPYVFKTWLLCSELIVIYKQMHLMQAAHCTGTPFWKLVLKQFDDYLVKVLIAAAVVDLIIALVNGERGAG
jgi:Cation transporter/ATPase, N-terminus